MQQFFYFAKEEKSGYQHVATFSPACKVQESTNPYFGGMTVETPDLRSLEQMIQNGKNVTGLEIQEGGSKLVNISPMNLFSSDTAACQFLELVKINQALPMVESVQQNGTLLVKTSK